MKVIAAVRSSSHNLQQVLGVGLRIAAAGALVLLARLTPVPQPLVEAVFQGRVAAQQGEDQQAYEYLQTARAYQPWEAATVEEAMWAAVRAGAWPAVQADLERLSGLRPLTADEYALLGVAHAEQGSEREALKAWEQAERTGTGNADALARLLEVYIEDEQWDRAINVMTNLIPLRPTDAELRFQLGRLQALQNPGAAFVALSQAVGVDESYAERAAPLQRALQTWGTEPLSVSYARLGAAYLTLGDIPFAERAFEQAVGHDPTYAEAIAYLGYLRALQGQPGLGAAQQAYRLDPDNPAVLYLVALTWTQYGEPQQARSVLELAFALDPENPALAVELGATYQAVSDYERAEIWMVQAAQLVPGDIDFQVLLAQFYVDSDYKVAEEGIPLAERLTENNPENAAAHAALGWGYYQVGQREEALAALERALELDPDLARARAHLGLLYEEDGQRALAVEQYTAAAALDPFGRWGAFAERGLDRLLGASSVPVPGDS